MNSGAFTFNDHRIKAAKEFAQTMVFVDDQLSGRGTPTQAKTLVTPGRKKTKKSQIATETPPLADNLKQFDAQALTESAMKQGLICSILQVTAGAQQVETVANAAKNADIVCLDWEMGDNGETACEIINKIRSNDASQNGRLRLVAIYTARVGRTGILKSIKSSISGRKRNIINYTADNEALVDNNGLKIVCLHKNSPRAKSKHSKNALPEDALPERLIKEFSYLSEGLLSNTGLSLIGAIRSATHHILNKFDGDMDIPFIQHRTAISNPEEATNYAISLLLSELKSAADNRGNAPFYCDSAALSARVEDLLHDKDPITIEENLNISNSELKKFIIEGQQSETVNIVGNWNTKKAKKNLPLRIHEILLQENAQNAQLNFKSLSDISAHSKSHMPTNPPQLKLGSILKRQNGRYYICIQALCDSSPKGKNSHRILLLEVFTTPENNDAKPDHVIPFWEANIKKYLKLYYRKGMYQHLHVEEFHSDPAKPYIEAEEKNHGSWIFKSTSKRYSRWIWLASLKQRRANRIAEQVSKRISRVGFDEFEIFRQAND